MMVFARPRKAWRRFSEGPIPLQWPRRPCALIKTAVFSSAEKAIDWGKAMSPEQSFTRLDERWETKVYEPQELLKFLRDHETVRSVAVDPPPTWFTGPTDSEGKPVELVETTTYIAERLFR